MEYGVKMLMSHTYPIMILIMEKPLVTRDRRLDTYPDDVLTEHFSNILGTSSRTKKHTRIYVRTRQVVFPQKYEPDLNSRTKFAFR